MPQVFTYEGGRKGVLIEPGLRVQQTDPPSAQIADLKNGNTVWHSGMEVIKAANRPTNIYGFDQHSYGGSGSVYNHDLNRDPGATGVPVEITEPCVLLKAKTLPRLGLNILGGTTDRESQTAMSALHFVDELPPAGSLPPPIGCPFQISRYVRDDIDFDVLPRVTPLSEAGDPSVFLNRIRRVNFMQVRGIPRGEAFRNGASMWVGYASHAAQYMIGAEYALCCDLEGLEDEFAVQFVIIAQDILEACKQNFNFASNIGLGGVWPGYKLILLIGAKLTGSQEMYDFARPENYNKWAEDRQCIYVTEENLEGGGKGDYIEDDLGMPEWVENKFYYQFKPASRSPNLMYRPMFRRHQFGQSAIAHLLGLVDAWGNDAFFDYSDRIYRNTFYKDPNSEFGYGFGGGSNTTTTLQRAMYETYVPPRWNWSMTDG